MLPINPILKVAAEIWENHRKMPHAGYEYSVKCVVHWCSNDFKFGKWLASENFLNLKSVSYKKEPIKDSIFGFTLVFTGIISVVFTCENDNFSHF